MFTHPSRVVRLLHWFRDNTLNILPFCIIAAMCVGNVPVVVSLALFMIYFIACQFRDLPLYKPLRKWGYDAFFLQYYNAVIIGSNIGRELVEYRLLHRSDYVLMGYSMFREYCIEMDQLDKKIEEVEIDNFYNFKSYYN